MLNFISQVWPFSLLFYKKLPGPPPLVPVFKSADSLSVGEYIYNPEFFVEAITANDIMKRFGAIVSYEKTVQDEDRITPPQWFIKFSDGVEINAGLLARFFSMYPEKKYPGAAVRFGISVVGMARAEKEMLRGK